MKTLLHILSSALLALLTTLSNPAFAQLGSLANDLVFTPITPCRIVDTRIAGGVIPSGTSRIFKGWNVNYSAQGGSATNCGLPQTTDIAALSVNLVVVSPDAAGYLAAWPVGVTQPLVSNLNFKAGDVLANLAILKINQTTADFNLFSTSSTHFVADVTGYYSKPVATAIDCVNVASAGVDLIAGASQSIFSPQCSAGYTVMSGACYRTSGTTGGFHNTYAFGATSSTNPTNPSAFYCGMNNSHPTDTSNVTASARCCRIPGR